MNRDQHPLSPESDTGRTYLERGRPVTVLARWRPGSGGPRNVLIRRGNGQLVVRPFRGLRTPRDGGGCQ
jgi:hypothetical protein